VIFWLWCGLLLGSSLLFVLRWFPEERWAAHLLDILVIYYGQVIAVFTILGHFDRLSAAWITAAFAAIFLISLAGLGRIRRAGVTGPEIAVGHVYPFLLAWCVYVIIIYFLPPLTTDGLLYHLPFALQYLARASLDFPRVFFADIAMAYYPHGGDLLYCFALFARQEGLLCLVQLPFAVMGALAVYLFLVRQAFDRGLAAAGASLFLILSPICREAQMCFVDLAMAGYFLAALYYFSVGDRRKVFLGWVAAGLLIGTKNLALFFFALSLPLFIRTFPGRRAWPALTAGLFFFLVIGGYSYWRNLFLFHNPVFPADISIGGQALFPGVYHYSSTPFPTSLAHLLRLFFHPSSAADPHRVTTAVIFLFLLIAIVFSFRRKESLALRYFFLIPVTAVILYTAGIPSFYHQVRHLLPVYGIFAAALVFPFRVWPRWRPLLGGLFIYIALDTVVRRAWLGCALLFGILAGIIYLAGRKARAKPALLVLGLLYVSYFLYWQAPVTGSGYSFQKFRIWQKVYGEQGQLWHFVQTNSGSGRIIAYVGDFLVYPLYGPAWQNTVYYQSVNSVREEPVHTYPRKRISFPGPWAELESIYRTNPSYEVWQRGLRENRADWIVIRPEDRLVERTWIAAHPEIFTRIYANLFAEIYQVNRP